MGFSTQAVWGSLTCDVHLIGKFYVLKLRSSSLMDRNLKDKEDEKEKEIRIKFNKLNKMKVNKEKIVCVSLLLVRLTAAGVTGFLLR